MEGTSKAKLRLSKIQQELFGRRKKKLYRDPVVHINPKVHEQLRKMCEERDVLMRDLVERLVRAEVRRYGNEVKKEIDSSRETTSPSS